MSDKTRSASSSDDGVVIAEHAARQMAEQRDDTMRKAAIDEKLPAFEAKGKIIRERARPAARDERLRRDDIEAARGALTARMLLHELQASSLAQQSAAINQALANAMSTEARRLKELMGRKSLTLANLRNWLGMTARLAKAADAGGTDHMAELRAAKVEGLPPLAVDEQALVPASSDEVAGRDASLGHRLVSFDVPMSRRRRVMIPAHGSRFGAFGRRNNLTQGKDILEAVEKLVF